MEKFKFRKIVRKNLRSSIINCSALQDKMSKDSRAFVEIQIEDITINGLLDSGASVSILGKDCSEIVRKLNARINPFYSTIKTAGGNHFSVVEKVIVPVKY